MVSTFMPDVVVEIAFNAGYTTAAASRTWTDVSAYVELADEIKIDFGRQDERSTADANSLTLTLDNTDGRFTALRSASPYYPNVKIGRPIRVKVTPPGGSTVTRFVGFIDEWPVEWDGTDTYAMAKIRASSRMARLGLGAKLRSMIEAEILQDRPSQYYTLGDPAGSTAAADSSGTGAARLRVVDAGAALTFGQATGPGTDELSALTMAGGQYLAYDGPTTVSGTSQSVECFMSRSGVPAVIETLASTFSQTAPAPGILIRILITGVIEVVSTGTSQVVGAVNVCDGSTHHVAVTRNGSTWSLYIDGVLDASTGAGTASAVTTWTPMLGETLTALGFGIVVTPLTGTIAHAAFWAGTTLTAARVAAHAANGSVGERTDQRLLRVLGWAGVASTEVTTETGVQTMTYQKTGGQSVLDVLRDVESTEGGVLFDGADGNVQFHNRSHRYLKTAAATLNMAAQHVGADYAPKLDRTAIINDATVSNPTTDETARSTSTTSSDEYGIATASATSVASTSDPLLQKAAWLVASYADPRIRVPSLTVDVLAHQGLTPSAQTLLGITVGDLLAVTNAPTQADTASPSYFVEGYTEAIGPESYFVTFNLSPTYPTLNTFVIGDATRGQLDSTYVLAL